MRRTAIYARYSTDLQSDRSIDDQVALCREHAARNGLSIAEIYTDRAKTSSSILGRDGLLRLMEDARAKRFDVVIVEAIDRISRDQEDLAGIYKRLTYAGVQIEAVHEGRADAIQIGIRGLVGHLFLADLKHKVRRGMSGVIRDGRHAGGRAYGYRPIPGKPGELQIFEPEADVVRRIFAEYTHGAVPREICYRLNNDGILPPRGTRWNASTINGNAERCNGILLNRLYVGEIVWNRLTMVRNPDTGRRVSRLNAESEWQIANAPQLAIIARDTWDAAQSRKLQRTILHEARSDQRPRRPLSGLLRCGCCGGGMSMHDRSGDAVRIRCSTARESGSCTNTRRYRLDLIERAIFSQLQAQLKNPEYLREYLRVYREERKDSLREAARDRDMIERQIAAAAGQLDRLVDLLARGIVGADGIEGKIAALQTEKANLSKRLAAARATVPVIELHPSAADNFLRTVEDLSARLSKPDPSFDSPVIEAVRKIISRVTLTPSEGGTVTVDVMCWLSALTGAPLGGVVVAEEGFEPPTQGL